MVLRLNIIIKFVEPKENAQMKRAIGMILLAAAALPPLGVSAEESQYGYVYTTDLLPQGKMEAEQWLTWRHGRSQGQYDVWVGRTEFEYGVSDRFQAAVYLNYLSGRAYHNSPEGETSPPENFAPVLTAPDEHFNSTKFLAVSFEGIFRVLSPYTAPVGLALYMEPVVGRGLYELESRVILQKNFLEDRLVLAGNVTAAQELRRLPADPAEDPSTFEGTDRWDEETDLNFALAGSYRFAPNWSAGAEWLNEREFSSLNMRGDTRTNSAYYMGPTVHYGGKRFFVTGVYLQQLKGARDYANPEPGFIVDGRTQADDFELHRVRVKIGWYF
jgi:hypothetical protein